MTPQPSELRDEHGKHRFEDEGLDIVRAIKRDYLPDMDSNDGGQILTWILDLCDAVHRSALLGGGGRSPEGQEDAAIRCSVCDQEVPDAGDLVCVDCYDTSQAATSPLVRSGDPLQAPDAPHVNPDFADCWQSGWRAGYRAALREAADIQRSAQ